MKKLILTTFYTMTLCSGIYYMATGESFVTISQSVQLDQAAVERYLATEVMAPNFGGEVYTTYKILDTSTTKHEIYVWALIQEHVREGDHFEPGTGMAGPLVLYVDSEAESFTITGHESPRPGDYYPDDVRRMFPLYAELSVLPNPISLGQKLHDQMEQKLSRSLLVKE
ncbi:hypothetical protein [Exiguobacterium sp. s150]|uniref:hypothetical protein n=1 Tax=Exiguobacterium sp. s150 TaxID=2751221 RepID=UPI0020373A63|nr:hypothetical protein [Exiguobacterium sp. s150]